MEQFFPEMIMGALKDAVIKVFWKKEDMRALLQKCKVSSTLINDQDWSRFKYHVISPIIDTLNTNSAELGPLRRVLNETLSYKDCSHLLWLNDGKVRKIEAEEAVKRLQKWLMSMTQPTNKKRSSARFVCGSWLKPNVVRISSRS